MKRVPIPLPLAPARKRFAAESPLLLSLETLPILDALLHGSLHTPTDVGGDEAVQKMDPQLAPKIGKTWQRWLAWTHMAHDRKS